MSVTATARPLREALGQLATMRDEMGVLSLYLDTGAEEGRRSGPSGGEIALRNALSELRERTRAEGPRERWSDLEDGLEELEPALADLVAPALPGRGRALFAELSGHGLVTLSTRHRLGAAAVLARRPYLMPLLPVLEAEQPYGAISVSDEGVRALDLAEGGAEEAGWEAFDIASGEWRRMKGPAGANPARSLTSASQVDLFKRRLEAHRERAVAEAVAPLVGLAEANEWTHVVLAGERARTEPLARDWPDAGPPLVVADVVLPATRSPQEVRRTAEPLVEAARAAEQSALVRRALDGALSSASAAAVGLGDVLMALGEGRVQHLLIDPAVRHAGSAAPDGRLFRAGVAPPGVAAEDLLEEPHLMERMLERALATDAEVTALGDPARDELAGHDGVAALLRW
jgi:hypothetical protein